MNDDFDELKKVCEERGIEIKNSNLVKNGDIVLKKRLNTVFIGDYIDPRNIILFIKKMTEN